MRPTPAPVTAAVLLTAVGLSACGTSDGPAAETTGPPLSTATSAPASSSSSSGASASSPTSSSPDEGDASFVPLDQPGEAPGSGSASVVGVRTGEHEGYERVVLDLEGAPGQDAGWYATAVPQPLQEASGELLDVDGDRFLDVSLTGIANGADGQADSAGRRAFTGTVSGSGDLVEEVLVGGAWEGQAQVVVGLDEGVSEYRVLRLTDPPRVVVDVR